MLRTTKIRCVALGAILAILGLSHAMASPANATHMMAPNISATGIAMADPVNPLPPFPPQTGGIAMADPVNPLPPFPPPTGGIAMADPVNPLPPFPPPTGGIAMGDPVNPLPPFPPPTGGGLA